MKTETCMIRGVVGLKATDTKGIAICMKFITDLGEYCLKRGKVGLIMIYEIGRSGREINVFLKVISSFKRTHLQTLPSQQHLICFHPTQPPHYTTTCFTQSTFGIFVIPQVYR